MGSYGAAVYTGNETKFGQNKCKPKYKISSSDHISNVFTVIILCFQVAVKEGNHHQIILTVILSPIGIALNKDVPRWYLETDLDLIHLIIPLRFLLLNAGMVPSTLNVLLELIKIIYTAFIHKDEHL